MRGCGHMQCIKCGKDTENDQVFCDDCLNAMEEYPVKATTTVHLPQRINEPIPVKVPHRRWSQSPEDQIIHLKKVIRGLSLALALLSLVLVIGVAVSTNAVVKIRKDLLTGKNYAVETTPSTTNPIVGAP